MMNKNPALAHNATTFSKPTILAKEPRLVEIFIIGSPVSRYCAMIMSVYEKTCKHWNILQSKKGSFNYG